MEHVTKRETSAGRWFPILIYTLNLGLWLLTGIVAGAWDLLWLVILPLFPIALYWWRTQKEQV